MAINSKTTGEDQGWSSRGTEVMETSQQNHQTGIQSVTDRTSPESEQYTKEFIISIYPFLNGTKAPKTKRKQKARCFKSRKATITNLSSYNLSEAERNLLRRGLNFIQHHLENIQPKYYRITYYITEN